MQADLHHISQSLSKTSRHQQRQVLVLAGSPDWSMSLIENVTGQVIKDSLWITDQVMDFQHVAFNKTQQLLGQEKKLVVFDALEGVHPDALAISSGLVIGGGLFIILIPHDFEKHNNFQSVFAKRFLHYLLSELSFSVVYETLSINTNMVSGISSKLHSQSKATRIEDSKENSENKSISYTSDQRVVMDEIKSFVASQSSTALVIVADRGRGKSAALGLAAASLCQAGKIKIAVTSPAYQSSAVTFLHAAMGLGIDEEKKGQLHCDDSGIQFYAPDDLMLNQVDCNIVFIDEAAAIPVPVLERILLKYPRCVFSTTVHGYEGTGRGFALRFNSVLDDLKPGWKTLTMKQPVRWPQGDVLEQWLFRFLCLDADLVNITEVKKDCLVVQNKVTCRVLPVKELEQNENLLRQLFAILIFAHYRTKPSDLKRLLDDEVTLIVAELDKKIVGVCQLIIEGGLTDELSHAVNRGERRLKGHLLAQSLSYHCGIAEAAQFSYQRIMRIAVHPGLQGSGIGSKLLAQATDFSKDSGVDILGASFGMTAELFHFWEKNQFKPARLGLKRDHTSGEYSAIMLKPVSLSGSGIVDKSAEYFQRNIHYWLKDVVDIDDADLNNFLIKSADSLDDLSHDKLQADLISYLQGIREYELCICSVKSFVGVSFADQSVRLPQQEAAVIQARVIDNKSWPEIISRFGFVGKSDARNGLRQALNHLYELRQL